MNGNESSEPTSSQAPHVETLSEEDPWAWERLDFDPPDICRARLRKMVELNSFLRGNPDAGNVYQ